MSLGEFIRNYRLEHKLSIRAFAALVGISPQQIANIEKGIGNNGKPMSSTMTTYKKIADGIGYDENEFLMLISDNVAVNPDFTDDEIEIIMLFRKADQRDRDTVMNILERYQEDTAFAAG